MSRKLLWIVFLLVCALTSPVLAQQEAGDSEIQLQGTISISNIKGVSDSGGVSATYGRFLTLRQEVGGNVTAFLTGDGDVGGTVGPFYRFNFSSSKVVPYVGGAATTTYGDFGDGSVQWQLEGGVRFFLDRKTAFSIQGVTYQAENVDFGDQLLIILGFSHLWGR